MKQSGTLSLLWIKAELCSHDSTKIGGLTGVLEKVLAVGRAVLHLSDDAHKLRVHAMDTQVDDCALTGFYYLVVELFLYLRDDFLNTCGMDATVDNQLVKGQTADLTTDRVES